MSGNSQVLAQFTSKEKRIADFVVEGLRNQDIAVQMGTTREMIKKYLQPIFDKSGTWSRLEFALWWLNHQ